MCVCTKVTTPSLQSYHEDGAKNIERSPQTHCKTSDLSIAASMHAADVNRAQCTPIYMHRLEKGERFRSRKGRFCFWQWLCWNPPYWKALLVPWREKRKKGRNWVCERNRRRPEGKRRETGLFGREVIPILWVTLLRETRTPTSLQTPRISLSHACTQTHTGKALLLSFLFKEKGCRAKAETHHRVITLISCCPSLCLSSAFGYHGKVLADVSPLGRS